MTEKLKPCRVCKAEATVMRMYDAYDDAEFGYIAGCPKGTILDGEHDEDCRVIAYTKAEAIEKWNRRTR